MTIPYLIARLACGLKKLPSEVRRMRLCDARAITDFWQECPPENEMLALLARVYTTWRPASILNMTEEEKIVEHRKSLQRRWDAGALNAQDLVRGGGLISAGPG